MCIVLLLVSGSRQSRGVALFLCRVMKVMRWLLGSTRGEFLSDGRWASRCRAWLLSSYS